jgi:hypothetical protein
MFKQKKFKQKKYNESVVSESRNSRTIADKVVMLLVSIMLFTIIIIVVLNQLVPRIFAFLIITVPTIMKYFIVIIKAADSIKFIVLDDKINKEITLAEKMLFDVFVGGLLVVYQFIPMTTFITMVENNTNSTNSSELILTIYVLLIVFFVSFITFVELIIPLRHLRKLFEFITRKIGSKSKRLSLYFWRTWDTPLIKARLTDTIMNKVKKCKVGLKIILFVVGIPAFIIDVIYNFAFLFYSFIVCSCLGAVIAFVRMVGKGILRALISITGIPGYRVARNAFRMSAIIALFIMVIINRTEVLYSTEDTFLTITEFLASAIIIPVIFEWIYSSRNSHPIEN